MRKTARILPAFLRGAVLALLLLTALTACAGQNVPESVEILVVLETSDPQEPAKPPELFFALTELPCYRVPAEDEQEYLGLMKAGTQVACLEERDGFMRVRWNDGELWCRAWLLAAQDEALQAERDKARLEALSDVPGFKAFDEPEERSCVASFLNCREGPGTEHDILGTIPSGESLTALGRAGSYTLVRLIDGRLCWCASVYLAGDEQCAVYPGAIDLRALLPMAQFELLFASENNITGRALYPAVPLMEEQTAYMLRRAYDIFLADGYILKVYDAYRPLSAQVALYDIVRDTRFIANPYHGGSWHNRGRAADISLVELESGEELEMPTPMHTFDVLASRSSSRRWSDTARGNVAYMTGVMKRCGFKTIPTEWWHFEYTEDGEMLPVELNYESLTYRHISEYFD